MQLYVVNNNNLRNSMICIDHFCASDRTKSNNLKKGAVPSIFGTEQSNTSNTNPTVSPTASSIIFSPPDELNCDECSNEPIEDVRRQNDESRNEYLIQQTNNHMQILKLEKQITDLKNTVKIQSEHIKTLNKKVTKGEKAKNSLENLLQELQQQKLISKRAIDILEVILYKLKI